MDATLLKAYQQARYVIDGDYMRDIKVGIYYPWLDELLCQRNSRCAVFITAFNPLGQRLTNEVNQQNNQKLKQLIVNDGYYFLEGYSTDDKEEWPKEESFLVLKMAYNKAKCLSEQFSQNAFLQIQTGSPVCLVTLPD